MCWFMSRCHNIDILNNVIICFQNVIIERKTLNDSCHKPYIQDICHVMVINMSVLYTPLQVKCYQSYFFVFFLYSRLVWERPRERPVT